MKIDISKLKFDDRGLIPAIVQDVKTDKVLMLAYMNGTSLARTVETGYTWFWSRSRQELWNKGATSGHTQKVHSITYDCDGDALLVKVEQKGAACHTGNYSCFFNPLWNSGSGESLPVADNRLPQVINELYRQIVCYQEKQKEARKLLPAPSQDKLLTELGAEHHPDHPGLRKTVMRTRLLRDGGLWYHCLVLLAYHNITPGEMLVEMAGRKVEEEK